MSIVSGSGNLIENIYHAITRAIFAAILTPHRRRTDHRILSNNSCSVRVSSFFDVGIPRPPCGSFISQGYTSLHPEIPPLELRHGTVSLHRSCNLWYFLDMVEYLRFPRRNIIKNAWNRPSEFRGHVFADSIWIGNLYAVYA